MVVNSTRNGKPPANYPCSPRSVTHHGDDKVANHRCKNTAVPPGDEEERQDGIERHRIGATVR